MCNEIVELVEEVEEGRVFTVEDGGIWFSGMNAHVGRLASSVASRLREEGYGVGVPRSDNAAEFGGLYLPVEEAREVDDGEHSRIVSPPGGDKRDGRGVVQ